MLKKVASHIHLYSPLPAPVNESEFHNLEVFADLDSREILTVEQLSRRLNRSADDFEYIHWR